ncbi:serine/threonine protein kinase [bacterium]|nr:serine/threonine protein kinase [bacterium]
MTHMLKVLETLGRYLLVETIASGGMATVYRAKLHGVEGFVKDVAIKKILPHWAENDEFIKMLVDEAKVLVHLNHANIVQVYELNRDDNIYYIVLEFVDGFDLRKITNRLDITRQKIPVPLTLYIIEKICMGLMYAHEKKDGESHGLGIVHRDISPQNILISLDGDVKITDFGISKIMGKAGDTTAGTLKGKFTYMSPEQAQGHPVDPRSDIFSLGIIFYELVTGHRLFKGINDIEILNAVRNCAIEHKYLDEAGIDDKLKSIILKTLAQNPDDRYASVRLLYRDLREYQFEKRYVSTSLEVKYFLQDLFGAELLEKTKKHREESRSTVIHDLTRLDVADVSRKTRVLVKSNLSDPSEAQDKPGRLSWKKEAIVAAGVLLVALLSVWHFFKKVPPALPETAAVVPPLIAAPAVERPEPKVPKPVFNARVLVTVEPASASVELTQGKEKIKLTPGQWVTLEKLTDNQEYTLSVFHPEYKSRQEKIVLNATQNEIQKTYTLEKLETGFITVSALPWGKVFLGGVIRGSSTPLRSQKVPVGTHTLSIASPDGKIKSSTRVSISKAKSVRCQVNFSQKTEDKKAPAILCQDS